MGCLRNLQGLRGKSLRIEFSLGLSVRLRTADFVTEHSGSRGRFRVRQKCADFKWISLSLSNFRSLQSGQRRAALQLDFLTLRGSYAALFGVFPVQLPPVAKESFVCDCGDRHAGAGDWGDDRDLQPGECGAVEAAALS